MVSFKSFVALTALSSVNALSLSNALKPYVQQAVDVFQGTVDSVSDKIVLVFPGQDERPVPGGSPIVQCQAGDAQLLSLHRVVIDPNPPAKGKNLTFVAEGYLSKTIEDGAYVEVDVRYGFIRLVHQTFDLCEEITKVDLECPIERGQQVIRKQVEIPDEVPPGKYIVNAKAYTKDDEFITCLSATVEFPVE